MAQIWTQTLLSIAAVSLVSLVGGLFLFGWSGLVLGPVILTVTNALLGICAKRFGEPQVATHTADRQRTEPPETNKAATTLRRESLFVRLLNG